jgi:hypothetical protein
MRKTLLRTWVYRSGGDASLLSGRMRRALLIGTVVSALAAFAAAGTANALHLQIGKLLIDATATITPSELPAKGQAPVEVTSVVKISTSDGAEPPKLRRLTLQFDKHGSIDTRGLPTCSPAKLAGTTTKAARAACPEAIVGEGIGRAVVNLPGLPQQAISSPLILFNAAPHGGRPALIVHARETVPVPNTLLTPIVVERIDGGRYGYRAQIELPQIAGGYGAATLSKATIGATRKRDGRTVGYANAYCAGGRLQVYGTLSFDGGGFTNGTLVQPCHSAD